MSADEDTVSLLLDVLRAYPHVQRAELDALAGYPETTKIARCLDSGSVDALTPEDFERVADSGDFLFSSGTSLLAYGDEHRDRAFLGLAIDLLEKSREHMETGVEYAHSLVVEGSGRVALAELGVDTLHNLREAVFLNERARREGFEEGTQEYALTLLNEAIVRNMLAGMDVDSLENFRDAAELSERARLEGLPPNSPLYAKALMNEANARQMIAGFGSDEEENFVIAVDLYRRAREEGLAEDAAEYPRDLIAEADTRIRMADLGIDVEENLREAQDLYRSAEKYENLTDGEKAKVYRMLRLTAGKGASAK